MDYKMLVSPPHLQKGTGETPQDKIFNYTLNMVRE
jgi:hypothetical protein